MNVILLAIVIVAGIGLVIGLVLAIASILMAVPKNEKVEAVMEVLPGANCGACGYSGCSGYAEALAQGGVSANLCAPGGEDVLNQIAGVLGTTTETAVRKTAVVNCMGTCDNTKQKMIYDGVKDCRSAMQLYGGASSCSYGCLGFGDCKNVCEYDAVSICNGIAVINPNKCKACTQCVLACPKQLIEMIPVKKTAIVLCSNKDKGGITRKVCSAGCIGCMRCVKTCPVDAVKVESFLAHIDPEKCIGCEECAKICPQNCIVI